MIPGLAGFFGGVAVVFVLVFAVTALFPVALAYLALRVRDSREEHPDPKLGVKTAFHLLHTSGVLMLLIGMSVFTADMMSETLANRPKIGAFPGAVARPAQDKFPNTAQRVSGALVGVGGMFTLMFWIMLFRTNDRTHPSVRRVFLGGRMTLALLIVMGAVTILAIDLVQRDPSLEVTETALGVLFVWIPAAGLHLLLFSILGAERRRGSRPDADNDDDRGWRPPHS
jgi:heme/copper-type cytochrome/quinol oxidase subunit 2